jgi:ADP-heptose:LPS heptosyltransferase
MFVNKFPDIKNTDNVIFVRSAFIGDWIVIVPFINYCIEKYRLDFSQIYFVIINNKNFNPVKYILSEDHEVAQKTYVVNSSLLGLLPSISKIRELNKNTKSRNHVVYLPFAREGFLSALKKFILSIAIFGYKGKYWGFKPQFSSDFKPESQYLSLFHHYGIEKYTLGQDNLIKINRKNNIYNPVNSVRRVGLYINSKLPTKIWDKKNYLNLILDLNSKMQTKFYLIGSSDDAAYNNDFLNLYSDQLKYTDIINLAGTLSISETLVNFIDLDILICNDGAPSHLAGLVNLPVITLFTFKEPVGSWESLLGENHIAIRSDVSCKHCYKEFCDRPICISDISVDTVLEFSLLLLEGRITGIHSVLQLPRVSRSLLS